MKINEVKVDAYKWEIPDMPWIGDVPALKEPGIGYMVRVLTDEGIEGDCTIPGSVIGVSESVARLRDLVVGQDPLNREKIWQTMIRVERHREYHVAVIGAVDVALWDLGGKIANLPVYKLMGGYRDKVLAYATSLMHGTAKEYIEEALDCKARGYTGYKVHPLGDYKVNIELFKAVRKAVGDDMNLMMDACGAYNHETAMKVGRVLEELNYYWYQNPLLDHDIDGYAQLARALDIPIAGTERLPGSCNTISEYIRKRAVDIVRGDVRFKGGITPLKKMATLAEAFGMNIEIHTTMNPLMNVANLHVLCSIQNSNFHELLQPEDKQLYAVEPWEHIDQEGYIHVPQKPGLGLEIDWGYISKHPADAKC